jgi:hypothetical protein
MSDGGAERGGVGRRVAHELQQYLFTAAFLAAFFGAVTAYRRLVLAEYHIGTFEYGWALVKALILAKIILIGDVLHVGRRFRGGPLLFSTLWNTAVFGVLVAAFIAAEHVAAALLHHRPVAEEFSLAGGGYEALARMLLEMVAFVPYFAYRELGRVLGEGRVADLFLRGPGAAPSTDADGSARRTG